ncbi:MAG: tetratricopeptide repeat protein [Actinobacteria bacterium]|nr:tetratricopeptide repeat protein [Actinomycetota bacterium]
MNRNYLVAIIVAAVVVVGLIVVVPNLDGGNTGGTSGTTVGSAPPIPEDATVPEGHPDLGEGSDTTGADATLEALVAEAEAAYEADKTDLTAVLALGDAYLQASRLDEATRVLNEALAIDAGNADAKAGLAMVDFVNGDTAAAQSKLEAVIAESPDSQVALYDLAVVYFSTDQRDKAKDTWAKVVEVNPLSELGEMAKQFIDLMGQTETSGGSPHGADGSAGTTVTTSP